jgi:hypothetical protein
MLLFLQQILVSRKCRLLLGGGLALVVITVLVVSLRSLFHREPTLDELRSQHLEYLVKLVEAYGERNGAYPQPTARMESVDGVLHVWGYEKEKASLPSCTVALRSDETPDADRSRCGGEIYDAEGNLLGWKGTMTAESGLNNIELAKKGGGGRVQAPLSELVSSVPIDPAYAAYPELAAQGFGEYVYAVRMPEDAAENRGGMQYQIALTIRDEETGILRTHIRGNYFVPAEERDRYPASLIGPGLLTDSYGNPVAGQRSALHVLADQQAEGFPNPIFGEGEQTLMRLSLERRILRLSKAMGDRIAILSSLPSSESADNLFRSIEDLLTHTSSLLQTLESDNTENIDLPATEASFLADASSLGEATEAFLLSRADETETVLRQDAESRSASITLLRETLTKSEDAEDTVLAARDEVLKYLDGEGIEEQSRNRAARKLQEVMDQIPDLATLFSSSNLLLPLPFLTSSLQDELNKIADEEFFPIIQDTTKEENDEVEESHNEMKPAVFVTTIAAELLVHFSDLRDLVGQIQANLENNAVEAEEIDDALRRLSRALGTENSRFRNLFDGLTPPEDANALLAWFVATRSEDPAQAVEDAAILTKQYGNFSPLLFDSRLLDAVILEQNPGIPDADAHDNPLEAEYKGIPYPLP